MLSSQSLKLFDVATMSQKDYENWFGGTPATRAKIYGLKRNALISLTVLGHDRVLEAIKACLDDEFEVVRETAIQARLWMDRNPTRC